MPLRTTSLARAKSVTPFATAACQLGTSVLYSKNAESGSRAMQLMMVSSEYWLAAVRFSPTALGSLMVFLPKMPRRLDDIFDSMAKPNEVQVNESSFADARPTPATTGISALYVMGLRYCPRTAAESPAVKTGSAALTMWANDTAPAPSATTAPTWVPVWKSPCGMSVLSAPSLSFGAFLMPVSHSGRNSGMPMNICAHATDQGLGRTLSACLL
mmetsp:Transcript_50601/g.126879  ORF Transcript_50601/g.126879 Transcript_50601/m.126879 type:complete len:214 (+) Transcript_50601:2006-2647(+)